LTMDIKYRPLNDEQTNIRTRNFAEKVAVFCVSVLFLSSIFCNVYFLTRGLEQRNVNDDTAEGKVSLLSGLHQKTRKTQMLVNLAANKQCDGTECPGGCCPYGHGWYCCPDGISCAISPAYCPNVAKGKTQVLVDLAANKQCDGTECPGGCCPGVYGWYCCSDGNYCAVTQADCPQNAAKGLVPKKRKLNQCDGTECWTVSGHYCCEGIYDGFCCGKSYTCSDQQTDDCPHKGFSIMDLI